MDDDTLRLAHQVGIVPGRPATAAQLADLVALARADEREACAKVCDDTDIVEFEHCMVLHQDAARTLRNAADAIRARSKA